MSENIRRKFDAEFKIKIVLSLLRGEASQQELGRRHNVSPTVISRWKEKFLEGGALYLKDENLDGKHLSKINVLSQEIEKRDQLIGELTLANHLLKKNLHLV
jgi:transposase-like protein